jgi:hypothetical protein
LLIGSVFIQADVVAELSIVDDKKRLVGGHVPTEVAILLWLLPLRCYRVTTAATGTVTSPGTCSCCSCVGFFR